MNERRQDKDYTTFYEIMIRFIKVKDIAKVDLEVTNIEKANFTEYLETAKANRTRKIRQLWFDSDIAQGYTIRNIKIPHDAEVITFSGDATEYVGGCKIDVYFRYENEQDEVYEESITPSKHQDQSYEESISTKHERFRFMLIPRLGTVSGKSPISFNYYIATGKRQFGEDDMLRWDYDEEGKIMPCSDLED